MRILAVVVFVSMAMGSGVALAQDDAPQCRETGPGQIVCDDWDIHGRRQVPTFVLLHRTRDHYEAPPLERDLTREIRRTVQRTPF